MSAPTRAPESRKESPVSLVNPATFDPFQLMDRFDEVALQAEMEGRSLGKLVYTIKEGSQEVTGLSKEGVDECCMALVSQGQVIREEDLDYVILGEGDDREALFKVKAARYSPSPDGTGEVKLDQVIGVKRQPLFYDPVTLDLNSRVAGRKWKHLTYGEALGDDEARDYLSWIVSGSTFDAPTKEFVRSILAGDQPENIKPGRKMNPHWYEQGAMKAARNARFRLIPVKVREMVIQQAKQSGLVKETNLAGEESAQQQQRSAQQQHAAAHEPDLLTQAIAFKLLGKPDSWGGYGGRPLGEVPSEVLTAVVEWATDKGLAAEDEPDEKKKLQTQHRMGQLARACTLIIDARVQGKLVDPPHKDGTPRTPSPEPAESDGGT